MENIFSNTWFIPVYVFGLFQKEVPILSFCHLDVLFVFSPLFFPLHLKIYISLLPLFWWSLLIQLWTKYLFLNALFVDLDYLLLCLPHYYYYLVIVILIYSYSITQWYLYYHYNLVVSYFLYCTTIFHIFCFLVCSAELFLLRL